MASQRNNPGLARLPSNNGSAASITRASLGLPSRSSSMGTPGLTPSPGASPVLSPASSGPPSGLPSGFTPSPSRTASGFQTQPPSRTSSGFSSGPPPPNSSAPSNAAIKAANDRVTEVIAKLTQLKDTKLSNSATEAERNLHNQEKIQVIVDLQGALTEYLKIKVNSLKSKSSNNVSVAKLSEEAAKNQVAKLQEQVDNNMKFFTDSIGIFGKLNEEISKLT
jgi:hypothetical protein